MTPRSTRRRRAFGALTASAVVALAACGPTTPPPPAPQVTVAAAIEREVNDWDEFSGHIQAVASVEVRPRVSGYIDRVVYREGAEVRKGDLLFVIDPRPYQAAVAAAEAEVARSTARLGLTETQVKRAEGLLGTGAISRDDFDAKQNAGREAAAALAAARAALEAARLNLDFTAIRAPISGRASRAEVTAGNLVSGTSNPPTLLTSIVSLDPVYVEFEGDEQIYLKYGELSRRGDRASSRDARNPVFMGLGNEQGYPHQGYMVFVDNQLNPQTGTIRGRAVFDNPERRFTPGLFARLKLIGSGKYRAVLIADRAIGTDQDHKFVLVVGPDSKLTYRPIVIGRVVDGLRVVASGLKGGERIVVNGLQRSRPGITVKATEGSMEDGVVAADRLPALTPPKPTGSRR